MACPKADGIRLKPKPNFANRTLFHGDNLGFLQGLDSGTVHLIATDPPRGGCGRRRNRQYVAEFRVIIKNAKVAQSGKLQDDRGRWYDPA